MRRIRFIWLIALVFPAPLACNPVAPVVEIIAKAGEHGNKANGIVFYVGGAGPIGNVGSWDVPQGLADGGYAGYVQVFTWQGLTHAGDQMNLARTKAKGAELAYEIRRYRRTYATQPIHLIGLSAGTGVCTFALEYLPESIKVDQVVFLGCSMSGGYDLTKAFKRIHNGLYVIHSANDPILDKLVTRIGTVDRGSGEEGIAGMVGFRYPTDPSPDTDREYHKLHNVGYRYDFAETGYEGGHTDSTKREFVRFYLAPVILGRPEVLLGKPPDDQRRTTVDAARRAPTATRPAPGSQPAITATRKPTQRARAANAR